jgi:glucose-6-phosphate isomerase
MPLKIKDNIKITNNIGKIFLNKNTSKKNHSKIFKIIDKIKNDIDIKDNPLHFFSKQFQSYNNKKELNKFKKFKTIIVVGMGGSILGLEAIYSFLKLKINKEVIFLDNLDTNKINRIFKKNILKNSLFILISKSGNTIETLINVNILGKKNISKNNTIIITERKNNALKKFSDDKNILFIEHKKNIGGRYSVLSEVGMVPAYILGLNPQKFKFEIKKFLKKKSNNTLIDNAEKNSQLYLNKKINSIVFLNYHSSLNGFIFWLQQLLSESLGKKEKGLLPTISPAPKDHHSLLQLYLDGPKDKVFYIFSVKETNDKKMTNNFFYNKFKYLKNKKISDIINSQKEALLKVFKQKNIPYKEIYINKVSEKTLGELFGFFMLETVIVAELINVNPYNQPAVEGVKLFTKQALN